MKTAELQPPNNPDYSTALNWAIVAAILFAFILHFSGCSPLPKAIQRVETNENSFNKVGADWARLHPCVTDSVVSLVHDTTTHTDTAYKLLPGVHLEHTAYLHDTVTQSITRTIRIHDSVKVVKVDESLSKRLMDSVYGYREALAGAKGASDTVAGQLKHSRSIWRVIALAALSLLAFIAGAKIYKLVSGKAIFS